MTKAGQLSRRRDPRVEQKCIYCGCTDSRACDVGGVGCHWISKDPPVCSAPACKGKFTIAAPPEFAGVAS